MGNIGGGEILVILLVALIVLGPDKLPDVARQVGKAVGEMRKISAGFQREIQDAMRVPDDPKPSATTEPAATTEAAAAAEATDTFLTTEPAALAEPTEVIGAALAGNEIIDDAAVTQSVEPPSTNELGEPAEMAATDDRIAMTETSDTFLTTEPAAVADPIVDTIVTPPEAPPLPTDAALGGDR
jgi:Tat protein translocase TatB subunit